MLIDTHGAVKRLRAANMSEEQAEAITGIIANIDDTVATKADIARLEDIMKFDRTLLIGIFLMMIGYLIKTTFN